MKKSNILIIIISVITIILFSLIVYLNTYSKADALMYNYLYSSNDVNVKKENSGFYFDGKNEDRLIIFYPGAKVEYTAYARLMHMLAIRGYDTYLLKMPFNISLLNNNAADDIINKYKYKEYYLMGHSMGGVSASLYTYNNKNKVKGLILLASYPTKEIPNNINFISIYGDKDGILNLDKYNESKKYWNKTSKEFIIKGANHSYFGNYGVQKGDNKVDISSNKVQDTTIEIIKNNIN